jgi:hypothetical protein
MAGSGPADGSPVTSARITSAIHAATSSPESRGLSSYQYPNRGTATNSV